MAIRKASDKEVHTIEVGKSSIHWIKYWSTCVKSESVRKDIYENSALVSLEVFTEDMEHIDGLIKQAIEHMQEELYTKAMLTVTLEPKSEVLRILIANGFSVVSRMDDRYILTIQLCTSAGAHQIARKIYKEQFPEDIIVVHEEICKLTMELIQDKEGKALKSMISGPTKLNTLSKLTILGELYWELLDNISIH